MPLLLTISKKLSKTLNASAFWGQANLSEALPRMTFSPPCSQQWSQQSCSPLWHCSVSCYICSPSGKFFSIYFIQSLVIYYLSDNSTPIKIYEFVLKTILDYVCVYEASHEPYILLLNLAVAPHNNNKTDYISPFLC